MKRKDFFLLSGIGCGLDLVGEALGVGGDFYVVQNLGEVCGARCTRAIAGG